MLIDRQTITTVLDIVRPSYYYSPKHVAIAEAIDELHAAGQPVDLFTVTDKLRAMRKLDDAGGVAYVTQLSGEAIAVAHVETHARIVAQRHLGRSLIELSQDIQRRAYIEDEDPADLLSQVLSQCVKLTQQVAGGSIVSLGSALSDAAKMITEAVDARASGNIKPLGFPSGLNAWDAITGGFQRSDCNIIAARPGMGKTALLLNSAIAAAQHTPVGIISMEMNLTQLALRALSEVSEVSTTDMRMGRLTAQEFDRIMGMAMTRLSELPIFLIDTGFMDEVKYRGRVEALVGKHNIGVLFVDYLQLMGGGKQRNREQEIASLSRTSKLIAKETNICVNVLSQLSREVERRGGSKRPVLSDLRESGAIEQDADNVTFIYRPEYYGITADEQGNSLKNRAELIVAKARHNSPGVAEVAFFPGTTRFCDLSVSDRIPAQLRNMEPPPSFTEPHSIVDDLPF